MATQGTVLVDFTSAGAYDVEQIVFSPGILSTSLVEAWMSLDATSSNGSGSAFAEGLQAYAGFIDQGAGSFVVIVRCPFGKAYGEYKVNWVWN